MAGTTCEASIFWNLGRPVWSKSGLLATSTGGEGGAVVAALIDTEDEAYLDLNGCLGVINMAVEDSRTDFAAVERMRRCMLINTRQYKNTLPTKYLIGRFIQETKQETCWKELSTRSQLPCKNCTQYPLLLLIVQVASTFQVIGMRWLLPIRCVYVYSYMETSNFWISRIWEFQLEMEIGYGYGK